MQRKLNALRKHFLIGQTPFVPGVHRRFAIAEKFHALLFERADDYPRAGAAEI